MELGGNVEKFEYTFEVNKTVANDRVIIHGVASTGGEDRDGEIVSMESLEKAFHKFLGGNPILLYNHNGNSAAVGKVIPEYTGEDGVVYKSEVRDNKLYIVGQISQAESARDVRTQIEEGILKALSIGGRARKVQKNMQTWLMISDLHEISVVPCAANQDAMFSVIKSCMGANCPIPNKHTEETDIMDKDEVIALIKGAMDETRTESEMEGLRQQVRDMTAEGDVAKAAYVDLQKKYDALVEGTNVETETPEDVNKALTAKLDAMAEEIQKMRTTPIQKGAQDGDLITKGGTDITSMIVNRHYGGT